MDGHQRWNGLAGCLAAAMILLLPAPHAYADSAAWALPYQREPIQIDGVLDEWPEDAMRRRFAETDLPADRANHVSIQASWTQDELLIAGTVTDQEWMQAPEAAQVDQFHHYDSLQIYLDPRGDSEKRMNGDDIDLLLLPDGRYGLLRGDELVAELAAAQVPQRESAPLAVRYASQRDGDTWRFELAVPFAGLGLVPSAPMTMKMDVAMNDWLAPQPLAPGAAISRAALLGQEAAPPNPAPTVGTELWPLTWTGQRDFGYPAYWQPLQLQGGPDWLERIARQLGIERLALAMAGLSLILVALVAIWMHWRNRRHLRALIARLGDLNPHDAQSTPPVQSAPDPEPTIAAASESTGIDEAPTGTITPKDATASEPDSASVSAHRDRIFAERAADYVRRHVSDELTPQSLADALHVSLRTLQRHLRDGLDTSPQELLLAIRLEAAAERLRDPARRIQEVAFDLGFQDLSHFSRRFRAAYGCTPSAYQQARVQSPRPN
ncbi:hypothetical protein C7S18_00650 [Ahniella affigens]|uniref:HTH araC/xylS-type domain-containing protein n=1 Tax=Ahniella affigens TaxID=2021234 RepID=A0A2P1PLT3_9GAMM|nr:helix-turn-helix domain-containing protein [Ahniella affigens]AVP95796.1 hypothetical protein C7S18_00650 [Ahniella affigens]